MSKSSKPIYQRVLLKLSGESLQSDHLYNIDAAKLTGIVEEVSSVTALGVEVALVIGAGNIIRGADLCAAGFDRVTADQMGMLATVINGLALRDAFAKAGVEAVLMSALSVSGISDACDRVKAKALLSEKKVVIFVGGTGNPLVTTDSAAALRGIEVSADIIFKATKVDGVFDDDPIKNAKAVCFDHLTYDDVIEKRLKVMDLNAVLLCQEQHLPLRVFNMNDTGAFKRIVLGESIGTLIKSKE